VSVYLSSVCGRTHIMKRGWSNICRLVKKLAYLVCLLFVFAYICFDILDLDGSEVPLKPFPTLKTITVAEAGRSSRILEFFAQLELTVVSCLEFSPSSANFAPATDHRVVSFAHSLSHRSHGYRTALPRSAPVDSHLFV